MADPCEPPFQTLDQAIEALADPTDPNWGAAFGLLAEHPGTAQFMLETFAETLAEMGIMPTGVDPATGEPAYSLDDVARALGVPDSELGSELGSGG